MDAVARIGASVGLPLAALCVFLAAEEGQGELRVALSNWAPAFLRRYNALGLAAYSPVIRALKADASPFAFDVESLFGYDPARPDEGDETARLLAGGGFECGVYLPVHGPGGLAGAAILAGPMRPLPDELLSRLHCLAFSMFGILSACRLKENRQSNPLSQREMDCLRLAMLGKTSSEIGGLLGLSEHTVSQHLASATRKLNAANRTHAVALAAQLGYLS